MRKLEVGEPRQAGAWTLVPVELTILQPSPADGWGYVVATKKPYAVILARADGARLALDTEGRDIPLTDLLAKLPALQKILSDVDSGRFPGTTDDRSVSK